MQDLLPPFPDAPDAYMGCCPLCVCSVPSLGEPQGVYLEQLKKPQLQTPHHRGGPAVLPVQALEADGEAWGACAFGLQHFCLALPLSSPP